jgi:ketosteroid isomerase-like protein
MNARISLCVLGLMSLCCASTVQAQKTGDQTAKAVAALEDQWTQSLKTNNPDLVAPLIADKYVYTGDDGKVSDRATFLANAKSVKWASVESLDEKITVFGSTAIATGELKLKGTASGAPASSHTRYTDVWVKMPDGKWQCVSTHESPLAK